MKKKISPMILYQTLSLDLFMLKVLVTIKNTYNGVNNTFSIIMNGSTIINKKNTLANQ